MTSSVRDDYARMARGCESTLIATARRLVRDDDRVLDLVQEALVRGYEAFRAGKFVAGGKPCAWLARILTNHFINEWRREKKWGAGVTVEDVTAGGEIGPEATRTASADMLLLEATLEEPLEKALAELPDALRLTVILVDMQELSYQEAAERLSVPVGTIRSRLARARFQLAERLQVWGRERGLV
ncbi:sigma-70 family RNA polymerase sigma factor [Armatimonas rosea]|uniref:RNA polymerase sigma-70 factor (ECF subfamily) n=1 Tax=Armatimonas rosea TaxID=685828 RepID=A0A7W9SRI7_ARMRO|nr:sigma-70 family RNA polymerase sigma factor [Armatimonas rosea]MBB6051472.1 RNA polymerase sigma-70 factor (ECF subfamily) [Armatimonas rosea]